MKSVVAALIALSSGSAFAANCTFLINGLPPQDPICQAFEPEDKESYQFGVRCYVAMGLRVWVDYGVKPENKRADQNASVVHFGYLNKFEDWYVKNETALIVDYTDKNPMVEVTPDLKMLIPSIDENWENKKVEVKCTL